MFLLISLLLLVLILAIGILVGVSWYCSTRLLSRRSRATSFRLPVLAVSTETITLQRSSNATRPGVFGITAATGQAIVGPLLSSDAQAVTRQLVQSTGVLAPQTKVAWNTTVYGGRLRDHLHLTIEDVFIPCAQGTMPAWFVPGTHNLWAILVHGATGTREQGLRAFQTLSDLEVPILAITYRNDEGAPASPDGLSHLGETEWEDLEASVKYALAQGAERLVLYGWSMGGTIVKTFLDRSSYADHIQAAVLDSPILDWHATLLALTKKYALPSFMATITEKIVSKRTAVQFEAYDQRDQVHNHLPILLFHGTSDTTAPIAVSDTFASGHAQISYHRIPDAEHTQCWNANPEQYEATLRSFLKEVVEVKEQSQ